MSAALEQNRLAYTYAEAAQIVGVSHWTIRRMVDEGQLASVKFRRSARIPREALEEYIQDQSTKEGEQQPCRTSAKTRRIGGSHTPTQAANELGNLLGLPTIRKPQP